MSLLPRYPVYVPSKGRHDRCLTAKFLQRDGVPFHFVVEPQEFDAYASHFPEKTSSSCPSPTSGWDPSPPVTGSVNTRRSMAPSVTGRSTTTAD